MSIVAFTAEVPDDLSLTSLREVMEMNEVRVQAIRKDNSPRSLGVKPVASVHLTATEREVLKAFTYCENSEEVAALLGVAPSTIKTHTKNLFRKLHVKSRAFAVGRALRLGLLSVQELTPDEPLGPASPTSPPYGGEISLSWGMGRTGRAPL